MGKRTHKSSCVGAIDAYICTPQSPWQRGSNENTNGLLRRYIPKCTDLSVHSHSEQSGSSAGGWARLGDNGRRRGRACRPQRLPRRVARSPSPCARRDVRRGRRTDLRCHCADSRSHVVSWVSLISKGAFERLGRYEAALWRQVRQTIFTLQHLQMRAPDSRFRRAQDRWQRAVFDAVEAGQ